MKTPQPVVYSQYLDIKVDVVEFLNEFLRSPIVVKPRTSNLPMPEPALLHAEIEKVVEEVPLFLGQVPKAVLEAIKVGHTIEAKLIEVNRKEGVSGLGLVDLNEITNPAVGGQDCGDALQL